MMRAKRKYTEEEREFFRSWSVAREAYRPRKCLPIANNCWVREGPPAMDNQQGYCKGCRDIPTLRAGSRL